MSKLISIFILLFSTTVWSAADSLCYTMFSESVVHRGGKVYDLTSDRDRSLLFEEALKSPQKGDYAIWRDSIGNVDTYYIEVLENEGMATIFLGRNSFGGRSLPTKDVLENLISVIPKEIWKTKTVTRGSKSYVLSREEDLFAYIDDVRLSPKAGDSVVINYGGKGKPWVVYVEKAFTEGILFRDGAISGLTKIEDILGPFIIP